MRKVLLCAALTAVALTGLPERTFAQRGRIAGAISQGVGAYSGLGGYGYGGLGSGGLLNQGLNLYNGLSGYGNMYGLYPNAYLNSGLYGSGYGNMYGLYPNAYLNSGLYGSGYGSLYGYPSYGWGSSYYGSPYYGGSYYYGSPYYGGMYSGSAYYGTPYYGGSYGYQPSYPTTAQQPSGSTSFYSPSGQGGQREFANPNAVNLQVRVPENAQLWIEGQQTSMTGPIRHFYSAALQPGQNYTYHLKARWTDENGKAIERTKTFDVHAGSRLSVDFMQSGQDTNGQDRNLNRENRDLNRQDRDLNRQNRDLNRQDRDLNRQDR